MKQIWLIWLFVFCIGTASANDVAPAPPKILFVCTGNYHRSRFAEAYLKFRAEKLKLPITVNSRGVDSSIHEGKDVSPLVLKELTRRGIPHDYAAGTPTPLTYEDLQQATLIIAMSRSEQESLIKEIAGGRPIAAVQYWEIEDTKYASAKLAVRIDELIERLVERVDLAK